MLSRLGSLWRLLALTALAVGIWAVTTDGYKRPAVLGPEAPAASFSASRAEAVLARVLGPEIPHPTGSAENAAVRDRIVAEFATLGIRAEVYPAFVCNPDIDPPDIVCRTVNDIVAEVTPGSGKAVVMMAHYDSVGAGPGASDNGSGVAAVLESARALRARHAPALHPVLALINDGEEGGLLGAKAFLDNPALKARVGAALNVDARGSRGRSILFQTSAGNGPLIDLYAAQTPFYTTSSLFQEIYKLTPNDTDLTPFLQAGLPAVNFAFADNYAVYHSPLDTRARLDAGSLQAQGDNLLGMAAGFQATPFARLKGPDALFLDLFGAALPRAPAAWALPVSIAALLLILVGAVVRRKAVTRRRDWVMAALLPPALIGLSVLAGYGLHILAQRISGSGDPSHAYPDAFRVALTLGVVAAAVLSARMVRPPAAAFGVWLWMAVLGVAAAGFLPGVSPYFLLPVLPVALTTPFRSRAVNGLGLAMGALTGLVLWVGLAAILETFQTLVLHPLFTVPAAVAAMMVAPLLKVDGLRRSAWAGVVAAAAAGAVACAVIAGLQPAYTPTAPKRITLVYVEDARTGLASYAAGSGGPLPGSLRAAAAFSAEPSLALPGRFSRAYAAPAGPAHRPPPTADILSDTATAQGRTLSVALHGPPGASIMYAIVPNAAKLTAIEVNGQHVTVNQGGRLRTLPSRLSFPGAETRVTLQLATKAAFNLLVSANTYGAPPEIAKLAAARPRDAVPSQDGDGVVQLNSLAVPAAMPAEEAQAATRRLR
jgi:hypothetical protein